MSFTKSSFKEFPRVFWSANITELFERAAYYSMASFVVLYLKRMGLGSYWPSTINGILWFLIYFLPILSGSLADHFGFRKALLTAFVMLTIGYILMGLPVWTQMTSLKSGIDVNASDLKVTAPWKVIVTVFTGLFMISLGGSIIKPCISGTVQKSSPAKLATLGFGIFYMVINIGSILGRVFSYGVRSFTDMSFIFAVASFLATLAFFVVFSMYREPEITEETPPKKDLKKTLSNMFLVLTQVRFVLFLIIVSGFSFIYAQVYNVLPLYLEKFVDPKSPVDLYTLANPVVIVFFQLLVTRFFGGMKPVKSIVVGVLVLSAAMLINIIPLAMKSDLRSAVIGTLPLGGLYAIITVAMIAFGELFQAARLFEFIGKMAPKGQEGLYMGYANLPMALGALVGGPVGAWIFNDIMVKQGRVITGWVIIAAIGVMSATGILLYGIWLDRQQPKNA
ncbi:MAG: MFS transporter [Deltaproteobacteria bacterium]|nr:MFS transporter [Deltaproteobacteria bacterium]